jgi:hypothetical protein
MRKRALKKRSGMETRHEMVREKDPKNCSKLPDSVGKRPMKLRTIGNCKDAIRERIGNVSLVGF